MDWDKLKIFHTVAEASSFTKASTILNLSQSAISRQIQSLESDLKVQLFERHARGLVLTENGEYLFSSAHEVISKLKDVESNLIGHKDKLSGKLTVTTVVSFGTTWLTPRIKEFMDLHPDMEIELIFDDKELDSMKTPSYPSGHSAQGILIAKLLGDKYPKAKSAFIKTGENISYSRRVARAHYKSDSKMGEELGNSIYKHIKNKI